MTLPIRYSAIAAALLLGACATTSTPAHFYTLSAPVAANASAQRTSPLLVETMPVRVPERLARPQIVVRAAADTAQVRILEHERWSSPFGYELHDAFASAITADLGAIDVSAGGPPAEARSYRIAIELMQFDAVPDDHLQASFSWSIKRSDDGKTAICRTVTTQAISHGISGVVQGVQQAVKQTAQEIVAAITALEAGNNAACNYAPE